jgi:hypothetical protein
MALMIGRLIRSALLIASCLLFAVPLAAQTTLAGFVKDSAGRPIANAQISIETLARVATADDSGHYLLTSLSPGLRLLHVRRVGYTALAKMVKLVEGEDRINDLILDRIAVQLDTVVTKGRLRPQDLDMLVFEEHRKIGLGHFVTRADLEKMRGRPIVEAFYQLPGLRIITSSSAQWVANGRGPLSSTANCIPIEKFEDYVKGRPFPRGANCLCYPRVYRDHTLISQFDVVPNLNRFTPDGVEAIEVFASPAQTPVEYGTPESPCGVVVFHSRKQPL